MLPIDIGVVAAAAAPYLAKGADAFSKTIGEKIAGKVVELCQTVGNKFKGDSYAEQTLARAGEKPDAKGRQIAVKAVLAEKMEADPNFAEEVRKLVEVLESDMGSSEAIFDQSEQNMHGPQTNIVGDVKGPVLSGTFSGNVNIQTNKSIQRIQKEMDALIAPLYSKFGNQLYFDCTPAVLGRDYPDYSSPEIILELNRFWSDIKKNLYLAPFAMQNKIKNFVDFKLGEKQATGVRKEDCELWLKNLIDGVNARHKKIIEELGEY